MEFMEVAPTPIPLVETTIQTSKDFKLSLNNKEFLAKIILTNLIKINLEENGNTHTPYSFSWCKNLSLEEFHQLNSNFTKYETLEQCYDCLIIFFEKNKVSFCEENEKFSLKFKISSLFGEYEEINIPLNKKSRKCVEKQDNLKLNEEIGQLKNKIKSLEEETKELKNIIKTLQEENLKFKSTIESRLLKLESDFKDTRYNIEYNIDSRIISSIEEYNFLLKRLSKYFDNDKKISFNLIYRASADGDEPSDFHLKCDNIPNVLVLYYTTKYIKFGGFSSIGFDSSNCGKDDSKAFIFNINNKRIYEAKDNNQIGCFEDNGPFFGRFTSAIYMYDNVNFLTKKTNQHKTNLNIRGFDISDENEYEINNGEQYFNLIELEVFQIK